MFHIEGLPNFLVNDIQFLYLKCKNNNKKWFQILETISKFFLKKQTNTNKIAFNTGTNIKYFE